jgi:hypothetical protein
MPEDELTNSTESEESQQQKNSEQSPTQLKPEEAILNQELSETIPDKSEPKIINSDEPVDKEENKDPISNEPITESNKTLAAEVSPVTNEHDELRKKIEQQDKKIEQQDKKIDDLKKQIEKVQNLAAKKVTKYSPKHTKEKVAPLIKPVEYLQENGEEKLEHKLKEMTTDELKNIVRDFKLKVNNIKTIQREEIITEIIKYAKRELNRGSSFLAR